MREPSSIESGNGFQILLRAHDHTWRDKELHWAVRIDTCSLLWLKALELTKDKYGVKSHPVGAEV